MSSPSRTAAHLLGLAFLAAAVLPPVVPSQAAALLRPEWLFSALALAVAADTRAGWSPRRVQPHRPFVWVLLCGVAATFVTLMRQPPSSHGIRVAVWFLIPLVIVRAVSGIRNPAELNRVFRLYVLLASTGCVIIAALQFAEGPLSATLNELYLGYEARGAHLRVANLGRILGTTGNANSAACLFIMLALIVEMSSRATHNRVRARDLALILALCLASLLTYSRTGVVLLALVLVLSLRRRSSGGGRRGSAGGRVRRRSLQLSLRLGYVVAACFLMVVVVRHLNATDSVELQGRLSIQDATGVGSALDRRVEKWHSLLSTSTIVDVLVGRAASGMDVRGIDNEFLRMYGLLGIGGSLALASWWWSMRRIAAHVAPPLRATAMTLLAVGLSFSLTAFFLLSAQLPIILVCGICVYSLPSQVGGRAAFEGQLPTAVGS